jgi:deoxyribodipyrimidine photo-lyase
VIPPVLLWLRQDLRLADHPALCAAVESGAPVIPVFLWAPWEEAEWAPGAASRWWLHESLQSLRADLEQRGSRLILRRVASDSLATLRELLQETGARAVFWSRRYEPQLIARDRRIKEALRADAIDARSFNAALLIEPWDVRNKSGRPFQVFTPFWKHVSATCTAPEPLPAPTTLPAPRDWPASAPLEELELMPRIPWHEGMARDWQPGEAPAARQLAAFLDDGVEGYSEGRNLPATRGTSRLSPHLHFGEISPRQIWHAARPWRGGQFMAEIGWREFAHHLLYHFPHTPGEPLRAEYSRFPWADDAAQLEAWRRGRTGVPLVDAGMRELWTTGWMHNRVRMVVGSFLVKNLRLHWLEGARWFWDTLVDADLAANTLGWQWTAGCGADAAPYFRVFNPVSQGLKFDPTGDYVRRWVPELARLSGGDIHAPWEARPETLQRAGIVLGRDYPLPIVDLKRSREAALTAWQTLRAPRPAAT